MPPKIPTGDLQKLSVAFVGNFHQITAQQSGHYVANFSQDPRLSLQAVSRALLGMREIHKETKTLTVGGQNPYTFEIPILPEKKENIDPFHQKISSYLIGVDRLLPEDLPSLQNRITVGALYDTFTLETDESMRQMVAGGAFDRLYKDKPSRDTLQFVEALEEALKMRMGVHSLLDLNPANEWLTKARKDHTLELPYDQWLAKAGTDGYEANTSWKKTIDAFGGNEAQAIVAFVLENNVYDADQKKTFAQNVVKEMGNKHSPLYQAHPRMWNAVFEAVRDDQDLRLLLYKNTKLCPEILENLDKEAQDLAERLAETYRIYAAHQKWNRMTPQEQTDVLEKIVRQYIMKNPAFQIQTINDPDNTSTAFVTNPKDPFQRSLARSCLTINLAHVGQRPFHEDLSTIVHECKHIKSLRDLNRGLNRGLNFKDNSVHSRIDKHYRESLELNMRFYAPSNLGESYARQPIEQEAYYLDAQFEEIFVNTIALKEFPNIYNQQEALSACELALEKAKEQKNNFPLRDLVTDAQTTDDPYRLFYAAIVQESLNIPTGAHKNQRPDPTGAFLCLALLKKSLEAGEFLKPPVVQEAMTNIAAYYTDHHTKNEKICHQAQAILENFRDHSPISAVRECAEKTLGKAQYEAYNTYFQQQNEHE